MATANMTKNGKVRIEFDPCDWNGLHELMETYGDSTGVFEGKNENGEDVTISISHDCIITRTYQSNGWLRVNYYHEDESTGETFDGRWKESEHKQNKDVERGE